MIESLPPRRQQLVTLARSLVGTPYRHQGRIPHLGLDCAGVVLWVGKSAGLTSFDYLNYPKRPPSHLLEEILDREAVAIAPGTAQPGDILLFAFRSVPQHIAILTEVGSIIHSTAKIGRCVEHRLAETWRKRLCGAYQYPE